MKKHEWMIVILPLVFTWVLDRLTKMWAVNLDSVKSFGGVFGFILHHNPGAMLGLFSELPPVLRIVSLSTGGAFLVCTYGLIQYLLPTKSLALRSGMSILLGGILGNVTDRILWGYVVDFIVVGNVQVSSPAFNVADALQWVGYGFIVYAVIREGELLWPENNARKVYWVNPKFQLKYCFLLSSLGLGISLISLVFSYTYLRVTMIEMVGNNPVVLNKFLTPFFVTFIFLSIAACFGLFTVGKIISHKIAGPIYAFERFVNDTIDGKQRNFKLRNKDEFQELENLAVKIREKIIPGQEIPPTAEVISTVDIGEEAGPFITSTLTKTPKQG